MTADGRLLLMPGSPELQAFGIRLKELRKRRGLSQKELAAAISVHHFQISKYETGLNYPTVGKLVQIARVLQIRSDQLLLDGVKEDGEAKNLRLQRRFKELECLPKEDQDTAVKLIDALVAKGKIRKLVG